MKFFLLIASTALAAHPRTPAVVEIPFEYAVKNEAIPRNPVVRVKIKGRDRLFIVDTGATAHVVDAALAKSLGLQGEPAEVGEDHYGKKVRVVDLPDLPVQIGPWKGTLAHPSGIARPESLLRQKIVGTISPQALIESGIVVMDLPAKKLLIYDSAPVPARKWLTARYPGYEFVELDRQGREMLVKASLPGRGKVPVLLDTGSGSTEFSDAYAGLDPGVYRSTESVSVGGHELRVASIEVRSFKEQGYMAGILGLDALQGVILAFRTESSKVLLGFPRR